MRIVLQGGQVFDGTGFPPRPADVVIADGRIVDVGPGLDGDTAVDVTGRTVLPGFFDSHVHVVLTNLNILERLYSPPSLMCFQAGHNLNATLRAGVTSIRDAGGADAGIKRAVETGLVLGPRMQVSVTGLSQTGGHGDGWLACGVHLPAGFFGAPAGVVDGPMEVRKRVRELVRAGADVIKVCTTGGVISAHDDPQHRHFRDDELAELVAEAAAAGIGVMSHAIGVEGVKAAVRAGIRSIEHGVCLDDEAVAMMLDHGTYLVPTLSAPRGVLDGVAKGRTALSDASIAKARELVEIHQASFALAVAAGVPIAMGTDSAVTPHGRNLDELGLMVKYGMAPLDALRAATSTAARLLGVLDDRGTLEPGKRADVVVVTGDVSDLETLPDRVEQVYLGGVAVDAVGPAAA